LSKRHVTEAVQLKCDRRSHLTRVWDEFALAGICFRSAPDWVSWEEIDEVLARIERTEVLPWTNTDEPFLLAGEESGEKS
jgi:hypothetical protein